MRKLKLKKAAQFALAYVAGAVIALVFYVLRATRVVRVEHRERVPRRQSSLLIISNHPSLLEPFVIPSLFFTEWALSPRIWGPWSTPDRGNLRTKLVWCFWIGGARNVPIPRKKEKGESHDAFREATYAALRKLRAILRIGGRIVVFPEGGRTTSVPVVKRLRSVKGYELRPVRKRVSELIAQTDPSVLPLWVEYPRCGCTRMRIKVGHVIRFGNIDPETVADQLQSAMLALADEGED
ncbi:MAG: 1-acyl-sn-glycerol-3-phosphate acyltransferase [Patescibacteria group bacterium]|nr:1-acyl-sn-glycerol-3-phosphate acyltransferase [Patescibacteria group bacterium]